MGETWSFDMPLEQAITTQRAVRRLKPDSVPDELVLPLIELAPKAASLALVHRRPEFRGAPASVLKMRELVEAGRMRHVEGIPHALNVDNGALIVDGAAALRP